MQLKHELPRFMMSPVRIILGSSSNDLVPEIARAAGAVVDAAAGTVDLVLSSWQWPATVANIATTGRLSATFARPSDYVSYQVKGTAHLVTPTPVHQERVRAYLRAMTEVFSGLGLDPRLPEPWLVDRDPAVARLTVEAVFLQTPGANAGQRIGDGP